MRTVFFLNIKPHLRHTLKYVNESVGENMSAAFSDPATFKANVMQHRPLLVAFGKV